MLLARPLINHEECLLSYLIRVAEGNGFRHIGHLLACAGLNWKNNRVPAHQILTGKFDLAPFLFDLGLPGWHSKVAPIYQSFQRVIDTPSILVKYPKVCPECLEELGYCKYQWAFLPVLACPRHKKMLVDVNPVSGNRLSWYRQHLNRFDGEKNKIKLIKRKAGLAAVQQSRYIESLLNGRQLDKWCPAVLQGLEFREALSLIHFIAHYQSRLLGRSFTPAAFQNNELAKVYEKVWVALRVWPDSFYALLSQYVDKPMSSIGQDGLNKHFRDLYEGLHRQQENQGVARIKREFDHYIQQYWPGVLQQKRITRIQLDPISRNIISKKEAASILGSRLERIDNLVQQGRLASVVFKKKVQYQRDQVTALGAEISSNWTMAEACEVLELSRYQLKQLLDAGLIPVLQKPGSLNRDWVIDKAQCLLFIEKLKKKARKSECPTGSISMAGMQRSGYSIVRLVLAMLNGEVEYGIRRNVERAKSIKQFTDFRIKKKV